MLTIAVDLATGDREGFLENPRQSDFIKVKVPFKTQRVSSPAYAFVGNKIKDDLDIYQSQSPLSQRAWTLQEDLLSPRSIHYADNQLVWECQKNMLTETDSTPLGTYDLATPRLFKRYFLKPFCMLTDPLVLRYPSYSKIYTTLDRWYRIFENYSNRLLTFEDDRFNAISGVAKELQQQSLMTYKAGIWLEDFRIGLLWIVEGRGMPASHYYAPSWSWASLKIKKHWGTSINLIFELYYRVRNLELDSKGENCELLSCTVGPATDDPFGRLLSGVIRLKGRWMPYSCWSVNTPTYFNTYWLKAKSHVATRGIGFPDRPDQLICSFDWEPDDSDIEEDEVDEFQGGTNEDEDVNTKAEENSRESYVWNEEILQNASLFQIGKFTYKASGDGESRSVIYALILISAGDSDTFRRIGVAEVPDVDEQGNTGWQTRDVSII
ncbi:hypothetical protein MMC14_003881 [Varicellaria rhodocarpa]|nr:hypothetical protein [Varicellaria rhodocarpa]